MMRPMIRCFRVAAGFAADPDQPTPQFIIDAAAKAMQDPSTHQYAFDNGDPAFRQAIADFMLKRYSVKLDPPPRSTRLSVRRKPSPTCRWRLSTPATWCSTPNRAIPPTAPAVCFWAACRSPWS